MLLQRFNKNQRHKTKLIHAKYGKETKRKIREKREERKILEEKAAKRRAEMEELPDYLEEKPSFDMKA